MKYFSVFFIVLLCSPVACDTTGPDQKQSDKEPEKIGEFIDDWTFRVFPTYNFDTAEFRLWVPDNTKNLRALLVLLNYHNSNGLGLADSGVWQEYAKQERLGLIGVHFSGGHYPNASGGSGAALLSALDEITKRHGIESLSNLPFLLRGYSAGGIFAYTFSGYVPERIVAFASIRSPLVGVPKTDNKITPPGLMLIAENDSPYTNEGIIEAFLSKRANDANWSYAIEPNSDHYGSTNDSDELIRTFFSKTLSKRLVNGSEELSPIPEQSGWLGNNKTKEVFSFDSYPKSKEEASWLIDEEFANLWHNYQKE